MDDEEEYYLNEAGEEPQWPFAPTVDDEVIEGYYEEDQEGNMFEEEQENLDETEGSLNKAGEEPPAPTVEMEKNLKQQQVLRHLRKQPVWQPGFQPKKQSSEEKGKSEQTNGSNMDLKDFLLQEYLQQKSKMMKKSGNQENTVRRPIVPSQVSQQKPVRSQDLQQEPGSWLVVHSPTPFKTGLLQQKKQIVETKAPQEKPENEDKKSEPQEKQQKQEKIFFVKF